MKSIFLPTTIQIYMYIYNMCLYFFANIKIPTIHAKGHGILATRIFSNKFSDVLPLNVERRMKVCVETNENYFYYYFHLWFCGLIDYTMIVFFFFLERGKGRFGKNSSPCYGMRFEISE